jgi:uncharacterized membrane protein YhaH (DUF805 family)
MNFQDAVRSCFIKYARARGRACRSEYWYWVLFEIIVGLISVGLDYFLFPSSTWDPIDTATDIALFLPSLTVGIRRLHDINRSGYWILIAFTVIGIMLLIYWNCLRGTEGNNNYGEDPLQSRAA